MIEPTETETKETLDGFVDALGKIVNEDPAVLHGAPHNTAVRRIDEAFMPEPTETESKETLDAFADAVAAILQEDPEIVRTAPHNTAAKRVDEVLAAREPILSWRMWRKRKGA